MPTWLVIVLASLLGLVIVFAIGGWIALRRQREPTEQLDRRILEANQALAQAHADDRGWDRDQLERAAREALEEQRPGLELERLELVLVDDRPGVDQDRCVFEATATGGEGAGRLRLALDRQLDGAWAAEPVEAL